MTILALALAALMGHEGVAVQMSDYSNRVGQANLWLRQTSTSNTISLRRARWSPSNCEEGDFRGELPKFPLESLWLQV